MNDKDWSYAVILTSLIRVSVCVGTMAFVFRQTHAIQLREPLPCSADEGVSCPAVGEWIAAAEASSPSSRQGDSRGKVRILGCDSIGHCEKKKFI